MPRSLVVARAAVATVTAYAMLLAPVGPLLAQSPPTTTTPPAPKQAAPAKPPAAPAKPAPPATGATPAPKSYAPGTPAAAPAAPAAQLPDGGWPRGYQTATGAKIIMYQPQVASWDNQKHVVAFSALSYDTGGGKPALGSLKIEADTKVAVSERLVSFTDFKITESNFPTLSKDRVQDVVEEIQKAIPKDDRVIGLDRVLASVDRSQIMPKNVEGIKADPPTIFFSQTPAIVINLDGEPIWSPIKDNDLKFAVNTNWDLFQHGPTSTLYLRYEKSWLKATDVKGPWTPAGSLPDSFKKLPADDNWKDVKAALPGAKLDAKKTPKVFVSSTPAELILLNGPPTYQQVAGTGLLWVNNTEADVFREGEKGAVYFLVAGRWFSSPGFEGPWTFATPKLPPDFQKISLEHPRSRVLAAVPGTQQAAEAVLLAQVPQTARVKKKELKAPEVAYQGDPKFEPIEKTGVEMATNTDKDIVKVGDLYYMCFQGVWFASKAATGPWEVTTSVPKEVYTIPTSSPVHNVTYVTVEDDDDDEWATFATVAAYTGVMVAWGCAVWGTGYYYPPYWGYGGYYPYYYPRYPTYGYGASYNPWTGAYSRGAVAYGPYGGAGVGARYNPRTGTYSRGAAAWGPYGARGAGQAYNPRTGAYGQTRQGSNVYGSWGSTQVQRGDQWASTNRVTNNMTGTTTRTTRTSGGGAAVTRNTPGPGGGGVARTGSGDVYAGRDGNVYRNQGGSWQKYDNGSWGNVDRPAERPTTASSGSTVDQLNRDRGARAEGTQRTRDYGSYRSSGGGSSAGSYRGGGGYSRGGGGSRRGGGRRR